MDSSPKPIMLSVTEPLSRGSPFSTLPRKEKLSKGLKALRAQVRAIRTKSGFPGRSEIRGRFVRSSVRVLFGRGPDQCRSLDKPLAHEAAGRDRKLFCDIVPGCR